VPSRGRRRPLRPIACPEDGRYLAQSDGQRLYFGLPQPVAVTRDRVTLCCTRPDCGGHVTWHPSAPQARTDASDDS
jgi:hypothetical protein